VEVATRTFFGFGADGNFRSAFDLDGTTSSEESEEESKAGWGLMLACWALLG
jgi:hypothetical protein